MTSHLIILEKIATLFEFVGVGSLMVGALYTLIHFFTALLRLEARHATIDYMRLELGRSIALGLEFFLAGDIIRTIVTPNYYEIGILSILVVIRTVLTYFLGKELATLRTEQD